MCGEGLKTLTGVHCHVDHIRPYQLRPDLTLHEGNLQLVCIRCHGVCQSIEKRNWPDADLIAHKKSLRRGFGEDGWPR